MKKRWKGALLALGLAAAVFTGGSQARADFSLQALINGTYSGPTTDGHDVLLDGLDFVFDSNSYNATGTGSPAASAINVNGLIVGGIDTLRFTSGWFASGSGFNDTAIHYTVHVLDDRPVTDLHLSVTGGTGGNGFFSVDDTVTNLDLPKQSYHIGVDSTGSPTAALDIAPLRNFTVSKDIFLTGNGTTVRDNARISVIDQGYSRAVPEPTSIALLGLGGLGAFGMLRRKRKTV